MLQLELIEEDLGKLFRCGICGDEIEATFLPMTNSVVVECVRCRLEGDLYIETVNCTILDD